MVYVVNLYKKATKAQPTITGGNSSQPIDKEKLLQEKNTVTKAVPQQNLKPKLPEYGKPIPKSKPEIDQASKAKLSKFISFSFL